MKTKFLKLSLLALVIFTASCSSDDDNDNTIPAVETIKVSDLDASKGAYTKFSFSENKVVTNDNWDIAFNTTTIIVNGGVKMTDAEPNRTGTGAASIISGTFASVTLYPAASAFAQDAATVYAIPKGSGKGWYNYDINSHIVSPIAGKVFVIKTHDGKYAKFEILSYYKGAPVTPDPLKTEDTGFYTFNFAYQANSTTTF
ncbi:HmuY family protein [Flavobacterium hibisci]|uniref:HmuY family protein n=1 Tax=Flavobacterium hibisci TaxID=1914462 RepID=UPI001CBF53F4|nr:HmuY family protein [Flavobacterium hibisci]MBZ4041891.1 HmuY family protein [Flavobacterium hibisci]